MTEKNGAAFPSPEDNSNHRHLERVVDELRTVLSDLGRPAKNAEPAKPTTPPEPDPLPAPFEAIQPERPEPEPVSSDADFWNGNVLGWSDKDKKESLESLGGVGSTEALPEGEVDDLSLRDLDGPLPSSKANMILGQEFDSPEPEKPPMWGMEEPLMGTPDLPKAPESPLERMTAREQSNIPEPMRENPFSPTFADFTEEQSAPAPMDETPRPASIPIPQTLDRKPEPVKPPPDPNLNLEAPDMKPKGVVQIACIFPEGQEKLGQTFVSKLREGGEKSKKIVNIQAVFVHPWASSKVDVAAWKKSAVLSGADTMFVLVSKAEAASLKLLSADLTSEIKCRIVYLEHIPMKTLYADILVDFQRGK